MNWKTTRNLLLAGLAAGILAGCGDKAPEAGGSTGNSSNPGTEARADLKGAIAIDGSSTVYPISQAVAEEFTGTNSGVNVTVSESGTGGGMKKFVAGEIDICDASRPIAPEEIAKAKAAGIDFLELPVGFDGLSVVVNPQNTWAESLTKAELKKIWEPGSKINNWKDVRPGFPDVPMKLYGPGTASGTFEYFTEAIVGKKKSSRDDYQGSEDDNVLVTGVAGEKGGLGYFGYAYYVENKDKIKLVKVDGGTGPVEPNPETISTGTYAPLSRPLFIYVTKKAMERPEVKEFVKFYLSDKGQALVKKTGYVVLPTEAYAAGQKNADEMKTGSRFQGNMVGTKVTDVLGKEGQ